MPVSKRRFNTAFVVGAVGGSARLAKETTLETQQNSVSIAFATFANVNIEAQARKYIGERVDVLRTQRRFMPDRFDQSISRLAKQLVSIVPAKHAHRAGNLSQQRRNRFQLVYRGAITKHCVERLLN